MTSNANSISSAVTSCTCNHGWAGPDCKIKLIASPPARDMKPSTKGISECKSFGIKSNNYVVVFNQGCEVAARGCHSCFDECNQRSARVPDDESKVNYQSACFAACTWSCVEAGVSTLGLGDSSIPSWAVLKSECDTVCASLDGELAREGCGETCAAVLRDDPPYGSAQGFADVDLVEQYKDSVFAKSSKVAQVAFAAKYCAGEFGSWDRSRDAPTVLKRQPGCIVAAAWMAAVALEQIQCTTPTGLNLCSGTSIIVEGSIVVGKGSTIGLHRTLVEKDSVASNDDVLPKDGLLQLTGGGSTTLFALEYSTALYVYSPGFRYMCVFTKSGTFRMTEAIFVPGASVT